jgi:C4-dicarboxylate-specific signal transduction histidine kinase
MELYRDQLLHAAVPGLTMGVMLHGAEKILEELREAIKGESADSRIKQLVERLYRAMRPVTSLLKDPSVATMNASALVREAIFGTELRLRKHGIKLIAESNDDFKVRGSKQMLVASITNLIDNSIHWLSTKGAANKTIYVGTTRDLEGGGAIVVADNGPGFGHDLPEDLITPFFTRRVGGMGLGLYIVSEVMHVNGGDIVFPEVGDVALPAGLDGAVVALQFKEVE